MASHIQPIKIYGQGGPNPPKIAILVQELGLPHEIIPIPLSDVKTPSYLALNPNGRLPTIHDPNTNITLWETGAIIEYLIETYDSKDLRLSFPPGTPEAWHAKQWLFFQTSGQGPYYGQAGWFIRFHPEKIPGAIDRYVKEVHRISDVLDKWLAKQKEEFAGKAGGDDGPWLVGNKMSYADLAFVSWQMVIKALLSKEQYDEGEYPHVQGWMARMGARKAVKEVMEKAFAQHQGAKKEES
ncbi:MAG: hypothetical protein Q9220_005582 [cf. Caloplaca sp. 1 TL-2023]